MGYFTISRKEISQYFNNLSSSSAFVLQFIGNTENGAWIQNVTSLTPWAMPANCSKLLVIQVTGYTFDHIPFQGCGSWIWWLLFVFLFHHIFIHIILSSPVTDTFFYYILFSFPALIVISLSAIFASEMCSCEQLFGVLFSLLLSSFSYIYHIS